MNNMNKQEDKPIGARTFEAEARLRSRAREALRRGYPNASERLIEHELRWFLGEDPSAPPEQERE